MPLKDLKGYFMTINNAIKARILELLVERKMTQYHLEKLSKVPHSTLTNILKGNVDDCRLSTLIAISSAFGLSVSKFLDDKTFENID